jgi:hypothetical protein
VRQFKPTRLALLICLQIFLMSVAGAGFAASDDLHVAATPNTAAADKTKANLYMFFTPPGNFIAANRIGQ